MNFRVYPSLGVIVASILGAVVLVTLSCFMTVDETSWWWVAGFVACSIISYLSELGIYTKGECSCDS